VHCHQTTHPTAVQVLTALELARQARMAANRAYLAALQVNETPKTLQMHAA